MPALEMPSGMHQGFRKPAEVLETCHPVFVFCTDFAIVEPGMAPKKECAASGCLANDCRKHPKHDQSVAEH